jgi:hypothetical protein
MMKDLINRLRGTYTVPVNDGAGLLDGKNTFTRSFTPSPINVEAADALERLIGMVIHYADQAGIPEEEVRRVNSL